LLKFTQLSTFAIAYLDIIFYYYCFIGEMWASVCFGCGKSWIRSPVDPNQRL